MTHDTSARLRVALAAASLMAVDACAQTPARRTVVASAALVVAAAPVRLPSSAPPLWRRSAPSECTSRVLGGHNYFFCPVRLGLDEARGYCNAFGAELATMGNRYENDAVAEVIRSLARGRHLIGHHDRVTEGRFDTVDGSPMSFSAWASGEPNNLGDEDCTELDGGTHWNDIPCANGTANVLCEESAPCTTEVFADHLYHFCRNSPYLSAQAWCSGLDAHVVAVESEDERRFVAEHAFSVGVNTCGEVPSSTGGAMICESDAPCARRFFEGRMYLFCLRAGTTGASARGACAELGGRLAAINDARTNDFVYASLAVFRRTHFYIDLRDDDTEGSFYDSNGPARFTAWAPGEPNNAGEEDCVELADNGWNDVPCTGDTKNAFVCELPVGG